MLVKLGVHKHRKLPKTSGSFRYVFGSLHWVKIRIVDNRGSGSVIAALDYSTYLKLV